MDIFLPYLIESRYKRIHSDLIRIDIRKFESKLKSFDCVLASEILEQMTKEERYELVNKMKSWSRKFVIITTPNGFIFQDGYNNNLFQQHKTGWTVKELKGMRYTVYGFSGWKPLHRYKG